MTHAFDTHALATDAPEPQGPATPDLFRFDNSYARLPARFFARLPQTPVHAPRLVRLNEALARELGLDAAKLGSPEGVRVLAGTSAQSVRIIYSRCSAEKRKTIKQF